MGGGGIDAFPPSTKQYSCQHGELECTINRFQGCVIKKGGGNQLQTFKAIYNEEVDIHKGSNKWNTTANEGLPQLHEVYACRDGDESWDIVAEFAKGKVSVKFTPRTLASSGFRVCPETRELQPPHGYTPWSTIDGIPFDFYGKKPFKETVCDAIEKSESMGSPRSAMETVKLAASRLAEVRRHERASSPDPFKEASDPSITRIRSELQAVHKKRRLDKLHAEQRQASNDFSGIDEGIPITQIMREDLIRGTEGDQRLKEWLEKYVYGCGSSSPSTSITTAATESI